MTKPVRRGRRSNAPPGMSWTPTPPPVGVRGSMPPESEAVAEVQDETPIAAPVEQAEVSEERHHEAPREIQAEAESAAEPEPAVEAKAAVDAEATIDAEAAVETEAAVEAQADVPAELDPDATVKIVRRHDSDFPELQDGDSSSTDDDGLGLPSPISGRPAGIGNYTKMAVALGAALVFGLVFRGVLARRHAEVVELPPAAHVEPSAALPIPDVPVDEPAMPALDYDGSITGEPTDAKREALLALELRHLPEAIAAGERAVLQDAADGEAWLVLGAAYQEAGQMVDARRCYRACVQKGRMDPRGECAAMLR